MAPENPESPSSALSCPRDGANLLPAPGSPDGKSCSTCGGLFLRNAATKASFEANGIDLEKSRLFTPVPIGCPACATRMKEIVINWVVLDLCDSCQAVWLDAGEMAKVEGYLTADHPRRHPRSRSSSDDFGVFGGVGDAAPARDASLELAEELMKLLRDAFDGRR